MKIPTVHFITTLLHSVRALVRAGSYRPNIELLKILRDQNYSNLKTVPYSYCHTSFITKMNLCYRYVFTVVVNM